MEIKTITDLNKMVKSKAFSGPVVIYGEEKELIKESVDIMYSLIKTFPEMNIVEVDGEVATYDEIINSCETLPFISDKKLVHVKNPYFLMKAKTSPVAEISDSLSKYIGNLPESCILLFSVNDEIDSKNKVVTVTKNIGLIVEYKKIKGDELHKWICSELAKCGKSIGKADLIYLISETGGTTESLKAEIEKLCDYTLEEEIITRKHIDDIVSKSLESNIFKMVDSISKKNAEKSLIILKNLLFQKEDHLRILGMIIRQYRMLYLVKLNIEKNNNNAEIEKSLRVSGFVLQNFIKQSRAYKLKDLTRPLNLCLKTDYDIKIGNYQPEMALELLIVELCK